jgi:MFS family permease
MWRSVFVPTIVLAFAEGMLVPVLPLYVASLGVPFFWVGLVLAAEAIGMLIADLPAGALLRRIDRKTAMLLGIGSSGSPRWRWRGPTAPVQVFALRLAGGPGGGPVGHLPPRLPDGRGAAAAAGRMIAAFGGATRIGHLAGPGGGRVIAATGGFGATFLAYAVVAAVALVFCAVFLERAPAHAERRARRATTAARGRRCGGAGPASWRLAGAGSLMAQAIRAGRKIVIPLYGATVLGLDVQQVGWIVSLAAAFDVSLFPVAGWVMDRFGRKWAIVPSFALQALGMALVPLTGGFGALAAAASLIGLGNGLGSGTIMTLGADLAPPEAVGEFLGVWRLIGDGGSMGGPVLVGALADALSLPLATLAIAAVGAGAALTFAFGVPETLHRPSPAPS